MEVTNTQDPTTETGKESYLLDELTKRLDRLEKNNSDLATENSALRERVQQLEERTCHLESQASDVRMKIDVLRQSRFEPASQRVIGVTELLEQILLECSPRQLFRLQGVCQTFRNAIRDLPSIQTMLFRNSKDVIQPDDRPSTQQLARPPLQYNLFLDGDWRISNANRSGIPLKLFPSKWQDADYWINDLSAVFSVHIGSAKDTKAAIKNLKTSRGRTYMTKPALPTSIRVNFVDALKIRDKREYERACKLPSSCPPNVTAIVEVAPATLLDMMKVADMLERYYRAGEKEWMQVENAREDGVRWMPKSATWDEKDLLKIVRGKPTYSGWTTDGPYRP